MDEKASNQAEFGATPSYERFATVALYALSVATALVAGMLAFLALGVLLFGWWDYQGHNFLGILLFYWSLPIVATIPLVMTYVTYRRKKYKLAAYLSSAILILAIGYIPFHLISKRTALQTEINNFNVATPTRWICPDGTVLNIRDNENYTVYDTKRYAINSYGRPEYMNTYLGQVDMQAHTYRESDWMVQTSVIDNNFLKSLNYLKTCRNSVGQTFLDVFKDTGPQNTNYNGAQPATSSKS